jgi:hypothetical protein
MVAEQQPPLTIRQLYDRVGVRMYTAGFILVVKEHFAIVVNQRESDKYFITAIPVNVRHRRVVPGRAFPVPEGFASAGDTPHVPVTVLDYEIFAPSTTREVRE